MKNYEGAQINPQAFLIFELFGAEEPCQSSVVFLAWKEPLVTPGKENIWIQRRSERGDEEMPLHATGIEPNRRLTTGKKF